MSNSEPELISADTLFNKRANVTFFSNFGSVSGRVVMDVDAEPEFSENVVSLISLSESIPLLPRRFSDN